MLIESHMSLTKTFVQFLSYHLSLVYYEYVREEADNKAGTVYSGLVMRGCEGLWVVIKEVVGRF